MQLKTFLSSSLLVLIVSAATNEPCIGKGGAAGVCLPTSACSTSGGITISGACPSDPTNIKCCTKTGCSKEWPSGNCRWKSDCAGNVASNQCPGPAQFKCCSSSATGFGGYNKPVIPKTGACKAVAVAAANKVVVKFPTRVREIGCVRDCPCPGSSDHCCGKAIDFMCSDGGGVPTISGREIAEWVMNNCKSLKVKYVIWGQRIWQPSQMSPRAWTKWKPMEDRHSITANHWDHVHVSFN